jgi:hypothetical protein
MARFPLLAAVAAVALGSCRNPPPESSTTGSSRPHVLLLHLDGYRPDLTKRLLTSGRLPHLAQLASRGRISFEATTVDKSETMKVIPAYLTSRLDSSALGVAGWWQFDRSDFRFRNFWLDPAEVANYALGLTFPRAPTVQDFLAARGESLVSSMSLARRGVPFENYGRAYLEGIEAVSRHTYLRQAHATVEAFLDIHHRIAERGERAPALSTLVLAAPDEFVHAEGVSAEGSEEERCFRRDEEDDDTVFRLLDEDSSHPFGGALGKLEASYFTRVGRALVSRSVEEVCLALPLLDPEAPRAPPRRAHPDYVLSMLVLDIELGYLIEAFRRIGLFDRTLFLVFGDHGMVDTPHGMVGGDSFLESLNRSLGLSTPPVAADSAPIGIDYQHLPERLLHPELDAAWQSEDVRRLTREADAWSEEFLAELRELVKDDLHESYWWLFFLRSLLIDPRLDEAMAPVSKEITTVLRQLYLKGVPAYGKAEVEENRRFFDRKVRLVYGGGALNNAELFLPACDAAEACSWERRPSYRQIVSYRGADSSGTTLLEALEENEGVGLVFIRRNNELFSESSPPPPSTEIEVRDRSGNTGVITASRDETGEMSFRYRTDPSSKIDPLGYEAWGKGEGSFGTYREWNDRTLGEDYVNAVGGMGAYLLSSHSAIGDVVVMHASGWNFGDNLGGHGGLHRFEKTTFLLASGPGIEPGELRARGGHAPTLLDLTPTALEWLGYSAADLEAFGAQEFSAYLDSWIRSQRAEILSHLDGATSFEKAKKEAGVPDLSLKPLLPRIERLLLFIEAEREATLARLEPGRLAGSALELRR